MESSARTAMEGFFAYDFSRVRVHADARASESARALNARAYTVADHVVFAQGAYSPSSSAGRKLLAHELAHVVQRAPLVQRQADGGGVSTGDLSKALGRRLPGRRPSDIAWSSQEIEDTPPNACLKGPRCGLAVPGSTLDARRRYNAVERRKAGELEASGKSTEPRAAVELTKFYARHAKGEFRFFRRLRQRNAAPGTRPPVVYVDPSMGGKGAGAWTVPCPDDPDASCIKTGAEREANAAKFNADPDAAEIGGMPRDEWKVESLQMFHHEAGHVRFGRAPVRGTGAGVPAVRENATHLELSELFAQLAEWPVLARHVVETTPSPDERPANLRERAEQLLEGDQNLRGTLDKIRCMNSCEDANKAVRRTFERAARSWPRWMRNALVEVLADPDQHLGWPMPPTPGWSYRKTAHVEELVPTRSSARKPD